MHSSQVIIHSTVCSYCLRGAKRLDGSYLRTFALDLKRTARPDPRYIYCIDSGRAALAIREKFAEPTPQIIEVWRCSLSGPTSCRRPFSEP